MTADKQIVPQKRNKNTKGGKKTSSNKDQATSIGQLYKIITKLNIQTTLLR
jgi:hypothetical protein